MTEEAEEREVAAVMAGWKKSDGVVMCVVERVGSAEDGVKSAADDGPTEDGGGVDGLCAGAGVEKKDGAEADDEKRCAGLSAVNTSGAGEKDSGMGDGTVDTSPRSVLPPLTPATPAAPDELRLRARLCMSALTISRLDGVMASRSSVCPLVLGSNSEPRKAYTLLNSGLLAVAVEEEAAEEAEEEEVRWRDM